MWMDEAEELFRQIDNRIESIDCDKGTVGINFLETIYSHGEEDQAYKSFENNLAIHFDAKSVIMNATDGDQDFGEDGDFILILEK